MGANRSAAGRVTPYKACTNPFYNGSDAYAAFRCVLSTTICTSKAVTCAKVNDCEI